MAPKFTLQSVLDYRHNWVEKLEIELGNLLHSLQHGEIMLENLENNRYGLYKELSEQQKGDIDMFKITNLRKHINRLGEQIVQVRSWLKELTMQIDAKRQEIIHAKQDEEVLVTLKNKENERFRAEEALAENRSQDDIYISRAYRNRRAGVVN